MHTILCDGKNRKLHRNMVCCCIISKGLKIKPISFKDGLLLKVKEKLLCLTIGGNRRTDNTYYAKNGPFCLHNQDHGCQLPTGDLSGVKAQKPRY